MQDTDLPDFAPIVAQLPDTIPFVAPEEIERQRAKRFDARIGANESAFGISPLAMDALSKSLQNPGISWYGDPLSYELRHKLAAELDVNATNLCVDAGIDSLLGLTTRLYLQPGDVAVTSLGAYPTFNYHVAGVGGIVKTVPYRDYHEDTEGLLAAAHQHTAKLVYLSNPDNPMGTRVPPQSITRLIDGLPKQCLLLLDEAYVEFLPHEERLALDIQQTQVIRFRTFSKAYGMAGMRIGYAIGHEALIKGYDKIRNHFGVNRLAQISASASLEDKQFLQSVVQQTLQGKQTIYDLARAQGLGFLPSYTNFVAVDFEKKERAEQTLSKLSQLGIFLRKPMIAPMDKFIRVGVGNQQELDCLAKAMRKIS